MSNAMQARKLTGCYRSLLQELGSEVPKVQQTAVGALDDPDPDVVVNAVHALERWGSRDAEEALWKRLARFREEWAGREREIRFTPEFESPGARAAALEQALVFGIAKGVGWVCPRDKLARLAALVHSAALKQQLQAWTAQWTESSGTVYPNWFPEDAPTFGVLQYEAMSEEQLRDKIARLPRGMRLRWQFWNPGQIAPPVSIEIQEAAFDRVRAVADRHGVVLEKSNQP